MTPVRRYIIEVELCMKTGLCEGMEDTCMRFMAGVEVCMKNRLYEGLDDPCTKVFAFTDRYSYGTAGLCILTARSSLLLFTRKPSERERRARKGSLHKCASLLEHGQYGRLKRGL